MGAWVQVERRVSSRLGVLRLDTWSSGLVHMLYSPYGLLRDKGTRRTVSLTSYTEPARLLYEHQEVAVVRQAARVQGEIVNQLWVSSIAEGGKPSTQALDWVGEQLLSYMSISQRPLWVGMLRNLDPAALRGNYVEDCSRAVDWWQERTGRPVEVPDIHHDPFLA